MKRILLAVALICAASRVDAQERIKSYDTKVEIRADGTIDVTERITVHAEGSQIRRGIYRDFPTRYTDRFGNQVKVDLQVLGVERDNREEPWFTERMSNGTRINTGNDDFLPVPADYTYTLRYSTNRQLGFFKDHDELYWNAIGTGWIFPIDSGTVEVHLPVPVPANLLSAEAYTGPQGAKGSSYVAEISAPGVARYRLTQGLAPYEGLTIVLSFPKQVSLPSTAPAMSEDKGVPQFIVAQPTTGDEARWFFRDNRGVLVALIGLIVLMWYMVTTWKLVGRDPQKGIVIARYEPREGQTPAGLRFMQRMGYDMRCFTADVLALAVGGRLRIKQDDGFFKDKWSLLRNSGPRELTGNGLGNSIPQRALLSGLFPDGKESLELKDTNASIVSSARSEHSDALDSEFQPRYFKRNGKKVAIAVLIAIVTTIAAFVLSGGYGLPAIVAAAVVMLVSLVVFGRLVRAPTPEGRVLLDEIEGLKLYMSVAEKQELASMRGPDEPPLDAKRYEAMLPYAVALDVEDAWTNKFTAAAGAAAAAAAASSMGWYSGRGPITNLGDFSHAVGSSLSSTISSASTPPGSSSGSGGGGSSGGGGGGGGGGGR